MSWLSHEPSTSWIRVVSRIADVLAESSTKHFLDMSFELYLYTNPPDHICVLFILKRNVIFCSYGTFLGNIEDSNM
jgi:hypothetical protein